MVASSEPGEPLAVNVHVACSIEATHVEAFGKLLSELVGLVGPESLRTLATVFVVDRGQVAIAVSAAVHSIDPTLSYMPNPAYSPSGVAVPLENAGSLECVIVIARELLESLSVERFHPYEAVSTVLEELLHVSVYEAAWRRRGYVRDCGADLSACELDVSVLVSQMSDEYIVNRRKAILAGTRPMFDHPDGALSTGQLRYGRSVPEAVSSGIRQIEAIVREASLRGRASSESWKLVVSGLYRGILEPLARHAAYDEGDESDRSVESLASVPQYRERVSEHWVALHRGLRRMFDSDLADTEVLLPKMSESVRQMLLQFGVEYHQAECGACAVRFSHSDRPIR